MTVEKLLEILSTKGNGQFIKVHWISNLNGKQSASSKKNGDVIKKDVVTTVRKGLDSKNIKAVQKRLLEKGQYNIDPKTGKIEFFLNKLSWGDWRKGYEGLLIDYNGKTYVRFYTTPNKPTSRYLLNGKEIDKEKLKELGVMQNSYWTKQEKEETIFMDLKIENIQEIY